MFATFENFTDALRADLEALEARINSANSSFESNGSTKTLPVDIPASSVQTVAATGLTEAGIHSNNSSFNTQSSDEKPPKSKELADKRTEYGLVWIMYMRAARRVESQQSARAIFGRCRKDRWIPWQVYEASGSSDLVGHSKGSILTLCFSVVSSVDGVSCVQGYKCRHTHF